MAKRRRKRARKPPIPDTFFSERLSERDELLQHAEQLRADKLKLQMERGELLQRNAHLEGMLRGKDALAHDIQALTNVVTKLALRLVETTEP